ncbi:OmpA family protein [Antribacter gilvus]|uniref:OmpA family protein n=1 Tax=Antribacter gilvus TaxID=2304675 RepID=UPI000F77157A|nr:OmpA family protein [Antribacter gilvus]
MSAVGVNADDEMAGTVERLGGADAPWDVIGTALFAPPPGDTVDVLFPELGAVLDVPVVEAGENFDSLVEGAGGLAEPRLASLRLVQQAYDASSATAADADTITVTLTSDVLFAPDADALTPEAQVTVDQAASAVREQADGGAIQVIGHTDDVNTDEYNQALGERRAQAVAARLSAALGEGFSVTPEGRGESDPAVDGTSPEARAANRRVEIEFEGQMVLDADPEEELAPTSAQTVSDGPVEIEANGSRYSVEVDSVVRRPGALVGTLRGELLEGSGTVAWFLPSYGSLIGERNFRGMSKMGGTHNLSLLTGAERVLPFDYEKVGDDAEGTTTRRLLGEELIGHLDSVGDVVLITVVWPDTGQDTVTIDAPERFRITDVPVTDG